MEELYIREKEKTVESGQRMDQKERPKRNERERKESLQLKKEMLLGGQWLECQQICIHTTVSLECHTGHAT